MKPPRVLVTSSSRLVFTRNWRPVPCGRRDFGFRPPGVTFPISMTAGSKANAPSTRPRIPIIAPDVGSDVYQETAMKSEAALEESLEKAIYRCRFLAFFGVCGSLVGSFLCFIKLWCNGIQEQNGRSCTLKPSRKDFLNNLLPNVTMINH
uniref:Transmembrane protein n=1 Tax=Nelumbo nucifera TaxID=4432 RepID=A0A822Y0H4_NELNU|nr:TPA_asm: hypothetical protein HUJ06_026465 [Nelumbo nucifera]